MWTWQHGDISAHADFNGDLAAALRSIREVLLIPCDHDLCFQVEDSRLNRAHLRNAELRPIPSIWGHRADNPVDAAVIATAVRELLEAASTL